MSLYPSELKIWFLTVSALRQIFRKKCSFSPGTYAFAISCMLGFSAYAQSHSILIPRSITHNATYELALDNYQIYHHAVSPELNSHSSCKDKAVFSFYATPFYTQSSNSRALAQYFLPGNASNLNIQENGSGNIGSLWLNLIAEPGLYYSSTVTISPVRKVVGSYFYTRFDLVGLLPDAHWSLKNIWFSASFAVMQVEHRLKISETLTGDAVYGTIPGITTGIQALNNPAWTAGKFSASTRTKSGVDDAQLKLGDNCFFHNDLSHIGLYLVGSIPTGNRPTGNYVFEPLVGTKHGAFGMGVNADFSLYKRHHAQLSLMLDAKYRYLFSAKERRSFDLAANGDWSRYLLMVNGNATSLSMPGINVTSFEVNVTPGSQVESWCALHYELGYWNIETGYNLWWRGSDRISGNDELPQNMAIYDIAGAASGTPVSASNANISEAAIGPNIAPSDAVFTPSTKLRFSSGEQPSALVNSLYLAMSYNNNDVRTPFLFGVGGGYEFANQNTLAQWSIWGKAGFSY